MDWLNTLGWMLIGTLGNMLQVAAIIGACVLVALPFIAYEKYQVVVKERDRLQQHVARMSQEIETLHNLIARHDKSGDS